MKKEKILIVLFIILSLKLVSSLDLISLNENVSVGETYVGFFEANLKDPLTKEDLKIYEERREVYFEKGMYYYKNKTFVYVIFPKEGNFSIVTKTFLFYENNSLKEGRINKTISVFGNSTKILGISPGIIVGSDLNFSLSNKGKEDLKVDFQNYSYELKKDETKIVFVNPEKEFFYLNIKSYKNFKIPVICIFFENKSINETTNKSKINDSVQKNATKEIEINQTLIEKYFEVNKTSIISFYVKNLAEKEVNISLKSNLKNLNFSKEETLSPFEERFIFLYYSPNLTGNFEENLTISAEKEIINVTLRLYVVTSESIEIMKKIIAENKSEILSCEEIGGVLCTQTGYTCKDGNNVPIIGVGFCCVGGECIKIEEDKPKKSFSNYVIGIISLLIAGTIGYVVYTKYKSAKPSGASFRK